MTDGHGDDLYKYGDIRLNFSSNIYNHLDHSGLDRFLCEHMESIHSYPEPVPESLESEWALRMGLSAQNLCVTNGATDAIYLIARAFYGTDSVILMPTFSEYADACRMNMHKVKAAYSLNSIRVPANGLCWICNPNNPTGTVHDPDQLAKMAHDNPGCTFIIDQSYAVFTDRELLSARKGTDCSNILILHSMTKEFAIPGLRLGAISGCEKAIERIKRFRMPWAVNSLAIKAGVYLLEHSNEYRIDIKALLKEKDRVAAELKAIGGIDVWNSNTHFLLCQLRMGRASALKDFLASEYCILIRDAGNFEGLDERFFRIAVQLPHENDQLIQAIKNWIYE